MIICVTGIPGSGKTTFLEFLQTHLNNQNRKFKHINSDILAKIIFDKYSSGDQKEDYSADELEILYKTMYFHIKEILNISPNTIILTDGTFRYFSQRLMMQNIADLCQVAIVFLKINNTRAKLFLENRYQSGGLGGWVNPDSIEGYIGEEIIEIENNTSLKNIKSKAETFAQSISFL